MEKYKWKVVPLCERQLRDVNKDDILNNGFYRKCNIYKGGGGYDKFSDIYKRRNCISDREFNNQFVVQLYGCPLKCPYCYVTQEGIFGQYQNISTEKILTDFYKSKLDVFHLMGGAPAIYIEHWIDILEGLKEEYPFHSDLLCVEKKYDKDILKELSKYKNSLYAVSIKGSTPEEFENNTNVKFEEDVFWNNLENLCRYNIPFYITFTGMDRDSVECFKIVLKTRFPKYYEKILEDSFAINLVKYKALD